MRGASAARKAQKVMKYGMKSDPQFNLLKKNAASNKTNNIGASHIPKA
jgi:hypothetical protein